MTQSFIDTDVIIRFLTGDDLEKQAAASVLFEQIEKGAIDAAAPDTVVADAVFVLSSARLYHIPRAEVRDLLTPLVRLSHFHIQNQVSVLRALDLFATTKLDFGDVMIVASMESQEAHTLYSYDADFDRFENITRLKP